MQKKIFIGLIIIAIIIIASILLSRETNQVNQNTSTTGTNTSTGSSANTTTTTSGSASITLTQSELAQHNKAQDCWLLINENIYVATSYIPQHPGGSAQITPFCGKDATSAFATQGGEGQHSSLANAQLNALLLGPLGAEVTQTQISALN